MPENVNTSLLAEHTSSINDDQRDVMVRVDHVSMVFNMASEQLNSLKEYAIAFARRELRFKEFRALDNISLEVKRGDVFGILGTNGSGKSTLLKIVAGVLEPTEGSCVINGNIAPLIELGAGFDMELTARENIYLNGALLGYPKRFIEQNFDDIVEFAEIEKFLDMPLKNYSSGMVARIAFAIATVIVPEILIVDEVLSVGDFMFQQKCEKRIMKLIKDHNVTVLIVSHNNDQIERLCNKAVWIEKGHVRLMGEAQEVCKTYRILGGRIGSKVSERRVFDMLQSSIDISKLSVETIAGEDRYGTAVELAEKCYPIIPETIIIASGDSAPHCLIATSLSNVFNAPVLLTKNHLLPDVTKQALKHYRPSQIIVLGSEKAISSSTLNELTRLCNEHTHIDRISGGNYAELSLAAFNYAAIRGSKWGRTAVLANDDNGNLISISPLFHLCKTPVFFLSNSQTESYDVVNTIMSNKFERVVTFDEQTPYLKEAIELFHEKEIEVFRFNGDGPYNTNELVDDWLESQFLIGQSSTVDHLIVASVWNPFDAFTAGMFASKTRGVFLLEDPQDIDSVSHALCYIEKKGGAIKRLTFLGDKNIYSDLDKELIGKAVAKAREAFS
ncbi:ATP-binding cassette domain-containing protein [Gordonibacter massiliensis (ex Traore et al. 2017)]|uniref:ATP-binding cassette domain-containing protein n=1 Tax=Gordonibacter massiliensis (ex Traore et al. 2017) TaxID=1841863 RepID=A0A842JI77_9ACTN|nr:ATP-binding cassette domain-containing protein [Gordonibacter massiliensis (ex Traore et al. 2017)]MBC2890766.1 ATP-binding cassette domain-containing protein [Gordonibacter massiliensis (ex Traore et al. 2017)]